jgi:hypothetical protein
MTLSPRNVQDPAVTTPESPMDEKLAGSIQVEGLLHSPALGLNLLLQ